VTAPLRILRADDHVRMAWANGGGTTYQVMTSPDGADLDTFDWRVSLAQFVSGGPFSSFPGIDRILLLTEGAGMQLLVDGATVPLDRFDIARFAGEATTSATLPSGPTRDLNVMTRRGRCTAELDLLVVSDEAAVAPTAGSTSVLVVVDGQVRADEVRLWERDVVVVDRPLVLLGTATLARIRISPS